MFRGEYGTEEKEAVRVAYLNGATGKEIHTYHEEYLSFEFPCQHKDENCE